MRRRPSRYLLVRVLAETVVPEETFRLLLTESILKLLGEAGLAEIDPRLFNWNENASTGIVKCTRDSVEKLRASISMISGSPEKPMCAYVRAVSGTSKGLKTKESRHSGQDQATKS